MTGRLWGVFGRPWLDLTPLVDTACFDALDREITAGLARVQCEGTGATLAWMGVVAPWARDPLRRDAMDAIRAMTEEEFADFVALGVDPSLPPEARLALDFGDETDRPFTVAQQRLLEVRHGVYFPWRHAYHLVPNHRWEDKHSGEGKGFTAEAREVFPRTCAFVASLPFEEVGRAVIFGLAPNDHAPLHRDTEPGEALEVAQSISFAPRPGKRLYLQNHPDAEPVVVSARAWWFNDMDYHGVMADPVFRYSVRVDGRFTRDFARRIAGLAAGPRLTPRRGTAR